MIDRGGHWPDAGEIEFTAEELAEMRAVVIGGPPPRRGLQAVPLENGGVAGETPLLRPTVKQRAFSPIDLLVEDAFARDGGVRAAPLRPEDEGVEPAEPAEGPAVSPDASQSTAPSPQPTPPAAAQASILPDATQLSPPPGPRDTLPDLPVALPPPASDAPVETASTLPRIAPAPDEPTTVPQLPVPSLPPLSAPLSEPSRARTGPSSLPPLPPPPESVRKGPASSPPPPPAGTQTPAGAPRPSVDARGRTSSPPPAVPPLPSTIDLRPKSVPALPAAAPAAPSSDGRARSTPPPPAVSAASAPATRSVAPAGAEAGARPAGEEAVFASSSPPDAAMLGFTVPEPATFRVIVGQATPLPPRTPDRAATAAPPAAAVTPEATPDAVERRDDAEELEAAEIEEVPGSAVAAAPSPAPAAGPPAPQAMRVAGPLLAFADQAAELESRATRRRGKPWFEELFEEEYLRTEPPIPPAHTEREAAFILDAFKLPAPAALLDVACGTGRHAIALARRGYEVTGLDLSLPMLMQAAEVARGAEVNVNFVHGDMRDMAFEDQFDAAYCWAASFGYFDDDTNRAVAGQIHRALKPGGRLLLDLPNRDFLVNEVPARPWWEGDGCMVLEELDFNYFTSRLLNHRSVVFEDGRQLEYEVSMRAYSLHEIGKLLHAAGFRVNEVSGSSHTRGRFFGAESPQILIVAQKK